MPVSPRLPGSGTRQRSSCEKDRDTLGEKRKAEPSSEHRVGCEGLTQHAYKCMSLWNTAMVSFLYSVPFLTCSQAAEALGASGGCPSPSLVLTPHAHILCI